MTPEQFFIQVLKDHLNGADTAPQSSMDWEAVLSLAQTHEVGGIIYHQCISFIPEEYTPALEKAYGTALYYYVNRKKAMDQAAKVLQDLKFCSVKGLEIAKFYPLPCLRTMGDCDIVVAPAAFDTAIERLRSIGFQGHSDTEVEEWSCKYKGMQFELHDVLVEKREHLAPEQAKFFNSFEDYVKDGELDWNFHYLYLIMHLRKHFIGNGVGIRQFMDVAVMINNGPELNWQWIEEKLEELKLRRFAHACYSLLEDWFEISAPVEFEKIDEETVKTVTNKILGNGVFGFEDNYNRNNKARNTIIMKDGIQAKNRIEYLLSNLFPNYRRMKRYPGCEFLIGRKYLLPLAWLRRFVYIIKSKDNKSRMVTVKGAFISEEDLAGRREIMTRMGLM